MVYEIYEGNIERLEKKLAKIENKCLRYGHEFSYKRVGEVFHERKDENGKTVNVRYITVEASGTAVIDGWEFVASLEYTEKGNLVKGLGKYEVPARYYECAPYCEHCKTNRFRKYSFVVRNTETGEFKQVGKNCLCDFTHGASAESYTEYVSWFNELIKGETPMDGYRGSNWYETERYARYVAETIRHFGYAKSDSPDSTKWLAFEIMDVTHGNAMGMRPEDVRKLEDMIEHVGFDADSDYAVAKTAAVMAFALNGDDDTNYRHNLKVIAESEYIKSSSFGLLASAFPAYDREMERIAEERKRAEAEGGSEYVGNVGERITIEVAEAVCVTGWETAYGWTGIWKITDTKGNVFTWKTGNSVGDGVKKLVGTVKGHTEFRGCKQTELTRCTAK